MATGAIEGMFDGGSMLLIDVISFPFLTSSAISETEVMLHTEFFFMLSSSVTIGERTEHCSGCCICIDEKSFS